MLKARANGARGRATAFAVVFGISASLLTSAAANADDATDLTSYVNPFIGTQDDGNTYPGAAVPFGMVQFSPDNGHSVGYDYGNDRIRGFSLVHLSGVGCPIGGLFPVLPTTGEVSNTRHEDYALHYSHDNETASPGYYQVGLDSPQGTVNAELTATEHTAVQRYTFPASSDAKVLLNPGQALNRVTDSSVRIVNDTTIETTISSRGFCQDTEPFTVHTLTTFDRPFEASGTWTGDSISSGSSSADGERTGAYVSFDATDDTTVEAVTALSYVDADGAAANLAAESATFDDARADADAAWEERLGSIAVPTTDENQARVFYSALYRSFLAPNTGTDVDGRYRGWDGEIHVADDFTYYQNFSLWDTYRTQQQLLYLLAPKESRDMAISVVKAGEQYGWLPRWGYGPVETNIMTGDPGTAFLVSAWDQGLLDGYEEAAYAVLKHNADNTPSTDSTANGRAGNPVYLEHGYVPHQPNENGRPGDYDLHHGASATLEYALSDGLLATMARALGHDDDADRYAQRAQNYRAIFDPTTENFRPRDRSGSFVGDPDPAHSTGFHEGTAVQYQWLVQQDMPGLIELLGGMDATEERLDEFFAYEQLLVDPEDTARNVWVNGTYSYYGQHTYNPNNEPDLHSPYVYLWTGQPWKSTDIVRAALTLFTNGPTGVTGNDDLGTMSAWYVLSSIGAYPIIPGDDVWGLSTPAFDNVEITLDPEYFGSSSLTIATPGLTDENRYIQSVSTARDGEIARSHLRGAELTSAGVITFDVGTEPSSWATGSESAPGALNEPAAVPSRLIAAVNPAMAVVAAGGATTIDVAVMAQSAGTAQGAISITGSDEISADIGQTPWELESDSLPVSTTVPVEVRPRAGVVTGRYPIVVTVTDDAGNSVEQTVTVVVADDQWLVDHFDNVGLGDAGAGNANFDGLGAYLLRDQMAALGFAQGAAGAVPGTDLTFVLPDVPPSNSDNIRANGQVIEVPAAQQHTRSVSLVGSGNNGSPSGTLVLRFTDDTSLAHTVQLSDWCTPDPADGNIQVAKAGQRGGGTNVENTGCGIYATAPIAVPEGKTLASLTLPHATNMHVFAIATDVPNPTTPEISLDLSSSDAQVGDTVQLTATVSPASATGTIEFSLDTDAAPAGGVALAAVRSIGEVALENGSATVEVPLTAIGTHTFSATFVSSDPTLYLAANSSSPLTTTVVAAGDSGDGDGTGDGSGDGDGDGTGDGSGDGDGAGDGTGNAGGSDGNASADDAGTPDTGEGSAASDVDGALSETGPVGVSAAILAALALIGAGVLARRRGRAATTALDTMTITQQGA